MSNLLNHGENPDKKRENPDKRVEVSAATVSRSAAGFGQDTANVIPTFDVNMRLDNHARNAILSLAKTTADKRTASEMVTILIENYVSSLNPKTLDTYEELLDMLETKDSLNYKLKKH
ncbi:DUF5388 domain-containing protein [Lactiplantibacillus plantarum]|uniref:DUF5388 domain-containing protein n=1 Tax=Lactiplantibacillus plantarum TaxID=1590 RepID=UPI000826FE1B|nr:DUF5388 domain-containing protein [Lactiplantibacillus plantarum]